MVQTVPALKVPGLPVAPFCAFSTASTPAK
jgi:hypothetical protein